MHPFRLTSELLSLDKACIFSALDNFADTVYAKSPLDNNEGGMGIEASFWAWLICNHLRPATIIESGVWRGFTTWIFDSIDSIENIYCFDPAVADPSFIKYKSKKAVYFAEDFSSTKFSFIDPSDALFFFDDHQDQMERLVVSWLRGAQWVLLDDNYFWGGGGHSSLADSMRNDEPFLKTIVENIFICPPLVGNPGRNYGIEPVFSPAQEATSSALQICRNQDNYNWLTLVRLRPPAILSRSQIPSSEYIIDSFSVF